MFEFVRTSKGKQFEKTSFRFDTYIKETDGWLSGNVSVGMDILVSVR